MITRQEMFDRAVRGLAAQNYQRCVDHSGQCCYQRPMNPTMRCAWGHIDTKLTWHDDGTVFTLNKAQRGVAADLSRDDLQFAYNLQMCHDSGTEPHQMKTLLQVFGQKHHLTWPKDVPANG